MTRRFVPTLAMLTGWCLLLGAGGTAEAGFISVGVERESLASAGTPSSMAASDETPSRPSPATELLQQRQAAWTNPFAPTSSGFAGTPTTTHSSGPPAAVLSTVAAGAGCELVVRLAPERDVWLPPPFFTGIFRPPRSVA